MNHYISFIKVGSNDSKSCFKGISPYEMKLFQMSKIIKARKNMIQESDMQKSHSKIIPTALPSGSKIMDTAIQTDLQKKCRKKKYKYKAENTQDMDHVMPSGGMDTPLSDSTEKISNIKLVDMEDLDATDQTCLNTSPPEWFKEYMEKLKTDIITEVSHRVMIGITKHLHKCSVDSPTFLQCEESNLCKTSDELIQYNHSKQYNLCNLHSEMKRHSRKRRKSSKDVKANGILSEQEDKQCSSEYMTKTMNKMKMKQEKHYEQKMHILQKKLDDKLQRLEKKMHIILEKRRHHLREVVNNLEEINKHEEDSAKKLIVKQESPPQRNTQTAVQSQFDENLCDEQNTSGETKYTENELRMNCSITGHQILDKKYVKNGMCCSGLDIDNISFVSEASNISNANDDDNFEIIEVPGTYESNVNFNAAVDAGFNNKYANHSPHIKSDHENVNVVTCKSNADTSSFELLSETPSPSSSISIDENHFSNYESMHTCEKNESIKYNLHKVNVKETTPYVVDINGKIYNNKHISNESAKCTNSLSNSCKEKNLSYPDPENLLKRVKVLYPFSKSIHTESQLTSVDDDVNDSHLNDLRIKSDLNEPLSQYSCQSQNDLGDLTQSFHSHTTSVTDNNQYTNCEAVCSNINYDCAYDVFERDTNATENKNTQQKKEELDYDSTKNLKVNDNPDDSKPINEKYVCNDSNSGYADPVHILPETLVTGAIHFASLAYGRAHGALNKFRVIVREAQPQHSKKGWH